MSNTKKQASYRDKNHEKLSKALRENLAKRKLQTKEKPNEHTLRQNNT